MKAISFSDNDCEVDGTSAFTSHASAEGDVVVIGGRNETKQEGRDEAKCPLDLHMVQNKVNRRNIIQDKGLEHKDVCDD